MSQKARQSGLSRIEGEAFSYLSLATESRLKALLEDMIIASKYRTESGVGAQPPTADLGKGRGAVPLWDQVVVNDVRKQILALDKVARQTELKRKEERIERERRIAAGEDPDTGETAGGADDLDRRNAGKVMGASAAARNMSEESRTKMANLTALDAAGLGGGLTKGWMMSTSVGAGSETAATSGANSGPPTTKKFGAAALAGSLAKTGLGLNGLPRPRFAPGGLSMPSSTLKPTVDKAGSTSTLGTPGLGSRTSTHGPQPYPTLRDRTITIKDALFVLERDRQGGRRGAGGADRVAMKWYNRQ